MNKETNNSQNIVNDPGIDKQDNDFFTEYLKGNSELSEFYKKIDAAEPPNKLDESILSAARASCKKSSATQNWWTQPGSWAASVAIISLAGILAHNTWQADKDVLQQEIQKAQQESLEPLSQQLSTAKPDQAKMAPDTQEEKSAAPRTRAKKNILQDQENDSQKLLYKAAPTPVMQSAPEHFELNKSKSLLKESQIQGFKDAHEEIVNLPEIEAQKTEKSRLTEQQIWLDKISQLIEQNKIEKAQKSLLQFIAKYPDYPIDPVILKHLSPY